MTERRRGKNRGLDEADEKPTKEEYAVAKYLRFGLPEKEGKLHGMEVKCFVASAAIDKLLESKWSASKNERDYLFSNRQSCVNYMHRLLLKNLFHRAEREKKKKDKDSDKSKKKKSKEIEADKKEEDKSVLDDGVRERKGKKDKQSKKDNDDEEEEKPTDDTQKKDEKEKKEKKDEKKKKEKRLKLVMPEEQWFDDGDDVFVWIYDPVNAKTFVIGLLMVLGAIGLCLFPLWPEIVRVGVYYISVAAAGFVGSILVLAVIRMILFCLVWVVTFGKHHFWFLPNLTEDVGFFDSFKPLYHHEVSGQDKKSKEVKKKKKEKDGAASKDEETVGESGKKDKSSDKDSSEEFEVIKKEELEEDDSEDREIDNDREDSELKEMNEESDEDRKEESEKIESSGKANKKSKRRKD